LPQFGLKSGDSRGRVTLVTPNNGLKLEATRDLNEIVSEESRKEFHFLKDFSNFNSIATLFTGILPVSTANPFNKNVKQASCSPGECFSFVLWTRRKPASISKQESKTLKSTLEPIKSCSLTQEEKNLIVTLKLDAEAWPGIPANNLPFTLPNAVNAFSISKPDGTLVGEVLPSFTITREKKGENGQARESERAENEFTARAVLQNFMELVDLNNVHAVTKFNGVNLRKNCEFTGLLQPVEQVERGKPVDFKVKITSFKATPLDSQDDSKDVVEFTATYEHSGQPDSSDVTVKLELFKQGTKTPYFLLLSGSTPSDAKNGLSIKWVKNKGEFRVSISGLLLEALKEYVDVNIKDRRVTAVFSVQHQLETKDYKQHSFEFPRSEAKQQEKQSSPSPENYFAKNFVKLSRESDVPVKLTLDNILHLPNGWSIQLINANPFARSAEVIVRNHKGLLVNCLSFNTILFLEQPQECKRDGDVVRVTLANVFSESASLKILSANPVRLGKPVAKVVKPTSEGLIKLDFNNVGLLPNGWSIQLLYVDERLTPATGGAVFAVRNAEGVVEDCAPYSEYSTSLYSRIGESVECGKVKLKLVEANANAESASATVIFEKQDSK